MNNNVERFRDALAGAVLGAIIAIVIFVISLIISAIQAVGGNAFEAMNGGAFVGLAIGLMVLFGACGYGIGYYWTKESTIRSSIGKWLNKHNK